MTQLNSAAYSPPVLDGGSHTGFHILFVYQRVDMSIVLSLHAEQLPAVKPGSRLSRHIQ